MQAGARRPSRSRRPAQALLQAYHVGFSTTLNHLMVIGAIVAFVGAVAAFALVRQSDFVVPGAGGPPSGGAGQQGGAAAPGGEAPIPAAHA